MPGLAVARSRYPEVKASVPLVCRGKDWSRPDDADQVGPDPGRNRPG